MHGLQQAALAVPVGAGEDDQSGRQIDVGFDVIAETA